MPVTREAGGKVIAGTLVAGLTVAAVSVTGAQGAGATTAPLAQSVGRFLDGAVGTSPIQGLVNLVDARATAPGTQSVQNPLTANLLNNALSLPLNGTLQLPQLLGITLGAANQVAVAHVDGSSYGASGAVDNSGGVSVGGNNAAFPADATIHLSATGIAGNSAITLPGLDALNALGGVDVTVGAVSALAQTPIGFGHPGTTSYKIAGLAIDATSPLLAGLVGPVVTSLSSVLTGLLALGGVPAACGNLAVQPLQLEGGAITLAPSTGTLSINLQALFTQLGLGNLATGLAPNTDLLTFLLNYLTSPTGLAQGLSGLVSGLVSGLKADFDACAPIAVKPVGDLLFALGTTVQNLLGSVVGALAPVDGQSPLAPLGTVLHSLVDIGANVQPNGPAGTFTSALNATPDQATAVVPSQTIVRALEVNILNKAVTVALANAAAGPSTAVVTPTTPTTPATTPTTPNTNIPTGVPAGFARPGGSPDLPLVLLVVGLLAASGGAVAYKFRGRHSA